MIHMCSSKGNKGNLVRLYTITGLNWWTGLPDSYFFFFVNSELMFLCISFFAVVEVVRFYFYKTSVKYPTKLEHCNLETFH